MTHALCCQPVCLQQGSRSQLPAHFFFPLPFFPPLAADLRGPGFAVAGLGDVIGGDGAVEVVAAAVGAACAGAAFCLTLSTTTGASCVAALRTSATASPFDITDAGEGCDELIGWLLSGSGLTAGRACSATMSASLSVCLCAAAGMTTGIRLSGNNICTGVSTGAVLAAEGRPGRHGSETVGVAGFGPVNNVLFVMCSSACLLEEAAAAAIEWETEVAPAVEVAMNAGCIALIW